MKTISVQELKDIASIEEIIGQYVALKQAGNIYKGLCPFHNEKTPSFVVNPEKKFFHCFGCGESGDIFNFLIKSKNLTFKEAVEEVARHYGYEIEKKFSGKNTNYDLKKILIDINKVALQEYKRLFKDSDIGKIAREYVESRKINQDMISLFDIGYAPDEWDTIATLLIKSNINENYILKSDIVIKSSKSGKLFDRFRYRLMFPIYDEQDVLIGFGGRTIGNGKTSGKEPAKYINSSDSELFSKRKNLYNLNLAKNEIKEANGSVIIVEGYFDVISCFQFGIRNVVAPLGTALTFDQLKKLERYAKKVILMFDGDNAGLNATIKSIDIAFQTSMEIYVVRLPEKDPFDFLFKYGKNELDTLIKNATDALDFKLQYISKSYNLNTAKGKENYINECFYFIKSTKNRILSDIALKKIAEISKISEQNIRKAFSDNSNKQKKSNIYNQMFNEKKEETTNDKFQKIIICSLFANKSEAEQYIPKLSDEMFINDFYKKLFTLMKENLAQSGKLLEDFFYKSLNDEEKTKFDNLLNLKSEYKLESVDFEKMLIGAINNLKLLYVENRIVKNDELIKQAEKSGNFVLLREYMEEAQYLLNERQKLCDAILFN